jgi:CelD/BcsL family acetyltransferase involved in cellulose biosynthesis
MPRTSATSTTSAEPKAAERPSSVPARLTVRRVPVDAATDADLAAWSALAEQAIEPNPFFEPELLVPAAHLYGGVDLGLIEDEDGRLHGALPLRRASRWRRIPAPTLSVWRHSDSYLGTPLLGPEAPVQALGALLDHARTEARAGLVAFEWIGTGGPVDAALRHAAVNRGLDPIEYEAFDRAALVRRVEPDYLEATVSKGRARELRRLRRQLAEQAGAPVEVTDRTGDPMAVEDFLAAEASGWKGTQGTAFLSSPAYADFFREVCRRFAAAGRLQFLVLSAGGNDIAWKVNFVAGDGVFCFKIAFDGERARFSPGIQLELDFVEIFHGTVSTWSDSCAAPDNEMINRLWPDRRSLATLLVPTGGLRGAASRQSALTAMAVRRRIRRTDDQVA